MASEEMKNNKEQEEEIVSTEENKLNEEAENIVEDATEEVEEVVEEAAETEVVGNDKAEEYLGKWQRTIAEFDNFRKRTIKEKSMMYDNGAREVLEKMLPVIDNFERAMEHIPEEEKDNSHVQGVQMIYKQLVAVMEDLGVAEIKALNEEFDTNLHHAVAHEDSAEHGDNEVAEVFQKGYMYKDRVLRHAMVKVVN